MMWWIARSTGLVAQVALAATLLCGLAVAGVPWLDRRRALALHETWTLSALGFAVVHALAVVLDRRSGVPVSALVLPFASPQARGAVALGTLGLLGLLVVVGSTVLRARIGPRAWRALHLVAYATFVLGLAHGLAAGTDAAHPVVLAASALAVGALVGASVYRAATVNGISP